MSISSAQCRAARALVGWSQGQLATASKVAKATIANFEAGKRAPYERTLEDMRRALEDAGVEFLGERQSLATLVTKWIAADPSRIALVGLEPGTSPEFVAEVLVADRYTNIATPAKHLIEIFEGATDPIGQEILALLRPIAGVEFIPENGGGAGVRLRND